MDKIGELLSDGESMKQLSELAQMLLSGTESEEEKECDTENKSQQEDTGCEGESDCGSEAAGSSFPDIGALLKLGTVMGAMNKKDKNAELLLALKPHLKEDKQEKVDKAVKLLKILAVWSVLKESGMLKDLL